MKINDKGLYKIPYTATDECGNETVADRMVTVYGYKTTLFSDGTLIINEKEIDRESNVQAHGEVINEYDALDADHPYVMSGRNDQPWASERTSIKAVEFGSVVAPTSMAYWFQATALADFDWTNADTSEVTSIRALFSSTNITELVLPSMPNLTNIRYMCYGCSSLSVADLSGVGAMGITDITDAFQGCYELVEIDLSGIGGTIDKCDRTFANLGGGGNMNIVTIYVTDALDCSQASSSSSMFRSCTALVGGDGTVFDANVTNKQYARIDGGPSAPGYFTEK